jgi:glutamate-1-semialdehyde 2,1-aminomutase
MPESHALRGDARQFLAGGASSHRKAAWQPFYLREARGSHIVDIDDNEYVDVVMGFGPNFLGHSPNVVTNAVNAARDSGLCLGIATPHEVELARKVRDLVPSAERMRFVVTGTEATMMAMRVARAFTGRQKLARFEGHYHGQHDAALVSGTGQVSGPALVPEPVADCAGIPESIVRDVVVLPWHDVEAAVQRIRGLAHELAAVIVEPIPFALGGNPPTSGMLEALRAVTEEHGILLIFDEVIIGFRLAPGGAAEVFGVKPDLRTFGKLVGGGYPIGIFGGRSDVMEEVVTPRDDGHSTDIIFQSGTFSGMPPAMVAGLAVLGEVEKGEAQRVADVQAARVREGWTQIARSLDLPAQVTGMSSWFGLYFTDRPIRSLRDARTVDSAVQRAFSLGLLASGVYLSPGHQGFASAAHTESDVELVLDASERVLGQIAEARHCG